MQSVDSFGDFPTSNIAVAYKVAHGAQLDYRDFPPESQVMRRRTFHRFDIGSGLLMLLVLLQIVGGLVDRDGRPSRQVKFESVR